MSSLLNTGSNIVFNVDAARYSKSKVYLHPTSSSKNNIPGFLSITQVSDSTEFLLSWLPEEYLQQSADYDSYVLVEVEGNIDGQSNSSGER